MLQVSLRQLIEASDRSCSQVRGAAGRVHLPTMRRPLLLAQLLQEPLDFLHRVIQQVGCDWIDGVGRVSCLIGAPDSAKEDSIPPGMGDAFPWVTLCPSPQRQRCGGAQIDPSG